MNTDSVNYTVEMTDPQEIVNCSSVYRSTEYKEVDQPQSMHGVTYSE